MLTKKKNPPLVKGEDLRRDVLYVKKKDALTNKIIENLLQKHDTLSHNTGTDIKGYIELTKYLFKILEKKSNDIVFEIDSKCSCYPPNEL